MTDLGCAGCEWAKGKVNLLQHELIQAQTSSKTAVQVVDNIQNEVTDLRRDFDKVKASTDGAIKTSDLMFSDNIKFKETISKELRADRQVAFWQMIGASTLGSGAMLALFLGLAKFAFHII